MEKEFDKSLLDILACPITKGQLTYDEKKNELVSQSAKLAFPIENGVPIMLEEKARKLS